MVEKAGGYGKWDACLDLSVRRVFYTTLGGAFSAFLLFRTPVTRWAAVALGAGVGIGSAYSDCSRTFYESPQCHPPKTSTTSLESAPLQTASVPTHQDGQE